MSRRPQKPSAKGSQFQIQRLVNDPNDPLGHLLEQELAFAPGETITWLSPLASDDLAEYRDDAFISRLGLSNARLEVPLAAFWPARGPQWDALAQTSHRRMLLIEAKSRRSEMLSRCAARNSQSLALITRALEQAQLFCRADTSANWSLRYYQYANRLAHLYWLRQLNGVDAHLVFVYFVNDITVNGPTSVQVWQDEIAHMHEQLGLSDDPMPKFVHHLFVDVANE